MHQTGRFVAEYFEFFSGLGWLDQWIFRYQLKWVANDPMSLEALLSFERALSAQNLDDHSRCQAVTGALLWYNREDHDERLTDRLPKKRLPDMLRVVFPFLGRNRRLHFKYRELIHNILRAGDAVAANPRARFPLTAAWFENEATTLIATLPARWSSWDRWEPSLLLMGNQFLACLEKIAGRASTAELFTLFRQEIPRQWPTGLVKNLDFLSAIAGRIPNTAAFTLIFEQAVPDRGLETIATLLEITQDFAEFEYFYRRTSTQVEIWGSSYLSLFCKLNNVAQLSWLLELLETYPNSPRVVMYQAYAMSHQVGMLGKWMNSGMLSQTNYLLQDLISLHAQEFRDRSRLVGVDNLIDRFEERLIDACLGEIWQSNYTSRKLRWGFDTFTCFIPYDLRDLDWTIDDEKHRSYWNVGETSEAERQRYLAALRPRLVVILHILDLDDFGALLGLLPKFLGVEEYSIEVNVPVAWEQGVEYRDGYNKYAGNYTEEVAVARPVRYTPHPFCFERPDLRDAIDLIDHMERAWHEIKAASNAKPTDPA
jgi:hypothetical protein